MSRSRPLFPLAPLLLATGLARSASTGSAVTLRVTGRQGGTGFGDCISDAGALSTTYRFFVEVLPGAPQLAIDVLDAEVGAGGSAEDAANNDAPLARDALGARRSGPEGSTRRVSTQRPGADLAA